jgi:hypothetical protein
MGVEARGGCKKQDGERGGQVVREAAGRTARGRPKKKPTEDGGLRAARTGHPPGAFTKAQTHRPPADPPSPSSPPPTPTSFWLLAYF